MCEKNSFTSASANAAGTFSFCPTTFPVLPASSRKCSISPSTRRCSSLWDLVAENIAFSVPNLYISHICSSSSKCSSTTAATVLSASHDLFFTSSLSAARHSACCSSMSGMFKDRSSCVFRKFFTRCHPSSAACAEASACGNADWLSFWPALVGGASVAPPLTFLFSSSPELILFLAAGKQDGTSPYCPPVAPFSSTFLVSRVVFRRFSALMRSCICPPVVTTYVPSPPSCKHTACRPFSSLRFASPRICTISPGHRNGGMKLIIAGGRSCGPALTLCT
mmetsp:Transcript_24824/g.62448  ORF Transcript_24824/g.62448 Transcript_24824/m.62448 type:complete len:279 (+) Transcript_24824:1027-1863(+)